MKRIALTAMLLGISLVGYETLAKAQTSGSWTMLLEGKSLAGWSQVGDANWAIKDGAAQADSGNGFLVSAVPYGDFEFKAEVWVSDDANSGVFIRCEDPKTISGPKGGYEINIFDKRPDPKYRTGAIVNVAEPKVQLNAGGKWNTIEISAKGPKMTVKLNGTVTAEGSDTKHAKGHIALQGGTGTVKWRNVQVRTL